MTAYPFTKVRVFCLHRKAVAIPVGEQLNLLQYVSCHRIRPVGSHMATAAPRRNFRGQL